ncbi:TIR domain-containing protein [Sporomusa acidovorans]|nr:hypothetical protein SPACI_30350 [Sporomusa acidovorans DSM 3132]SDD70162.1 TIR domain-containing protein [Sporomusa acidovorans]
MNVLLIHPSLSLFSLETSQFYEALRKELEKHVRVISVGSIELLKSSSPTSGDAIIFFNRDDQNYSKLLIELLSEAKEIRCEIIPVAINEKTRIPPTIIQDCQSFDVYEYLANRCLSQDYLETAAVGLARSITAKIQPTLSRDGMQLFLSYRRFDGEAFARSFHQKLQLRFEQGFRDLINIRTGENAQNIIEENLSNSDAVIFLDTPKSGESSWIARELAIALSLNIPILWIQIGDSDRVKLSVKPADKPHFSLPISMLKSEEVDSTFVDEVIQKTFDIAREHACVVFDDLRRIKALREKHLVLIEKDKKHMVYEVKIPRPSFRYQQKPISHLVQFYGRRPQDKDYEMLLEKSRCLGCQPEQYDAAILLGITPAQSPAYKEHFYIDSSSEYVAMLESYFTSNNKENKHKGFIISGAFPDCEPQYQQNITTAVHAFAQVILDQGGVVIFGGHPTFQHLIFDMAQRRRPNDFIGAIHVYVSELFVGLGAAEDFRKKATTIVTKNIDDDRTKSLTVMREAMISDNCAMGMIVIGGKTDSGGHNPGIDEEIELAQKAGLPVFVLGSVGGRSSEIAMSLDKQGWKKSLNKLPIQQNKQLLLSTDYATLANIVIQSVGF